MVIHMSQTPLRGHGADLTVHRSLMTVLGTRWVRSTGLAAVMSGAEASWRYLKGHQQTEGLAQDACQPLECADQISG